MKHRCLSLVLAISMIMASASPFSYAKDTQGGYCKILERLLQMKQKRYCR